MSDMHALTSQKGSVYIRHDRQSKTNLVLITDSNGRTYGVIGHDPQFFKSTDFGPTFAREKYPSKSMSIHIQTQQYADTVRSCHTVVYASLQCK